MCRYDMLIALLRGERMRVVWAVVMVMSASVAWAQDAAPRNPVLERVLREWPAGKIDTTKNPGGWSYEEGVLLDGVTAEWRATGDGRLFKYVKDAVDASVDKSGTIHMYGDKPFPVDGHSMDDIEMGRADLVVYRVTQDARYYTAAKFLHDQMKQQPKNASGGYWHKQIYPDQMWLDGAYMSEPFMAGYARTFGQDKEMEEVATQLLLINTKMRDRKTGLLYHGWDESKKMGWADKKTGLSPEFWARAMGWYAMAMMDVLERMPDNDPQRAALEEVARRTMNAVVKVQDPATGLWWQVLDRGAKAGADAKAVAEKTSAGNYLEASASCMFVYALAKGVRLGVLPASYGAAAARGWAGVQSHFVKPDGTFSGTVKVAGLGGTPYRSGTYEYYVGEAVRRQRFQGRGIVSAGRQRDDPEGPRRRADGEGQRQDRACGWLVQLADAQDGRRPRGAVPLQVFGRCEQRVCVRGKDVSAIRDAYGDVGPCSAGRRFAGCDDLRFTVTGYSVAEPEAELYGRTERGSD